MNINQATQYINQNIGLFVFVDNGGASAKVKQHFQNYGSDLLRSHNNKGGLLVKGSNFSDSQFTPIGNKVGAKSGFFSGVKFPIIVSNGKSISESEFLRMT